MTYVLGAKSRANATRVDPKLLALVPVALTYSYVDFGIQEEQSRTVAQQREKVRRGVSKTMNSAHVIKAGATHSTGLDLVPWIDGRFQWGDNQWRVKTAAGETLEPFYVIAAAMQRAANEAGVRLVWGAIWDRVLNDLPLGAKALKAAMEAYKVRHPGPASSMVRTSRSGREGVPSRLHPDGLAGDRPARRPRRQPVLLRLRRRPGPARRRGAGHAEWPDPANRRQRPRKGCRQATDRRPHNQRPRKGTLRCDCLAP